MSASSVPATQHEYRNKGRGLDNLVLNKDVPVPKPGPRDVLMRVRAVSLNHRDLIILNHPNAYPSKKEVVPTSDGAGEVVAVGSEVTQWAVGDRVAGIFFPDLQAGVLHGVPMKAPALGGSVDGMLTQFKLLPETALVRLPKNMSFEQAATLPCAAVTAWNALLQAHKPLTSAHTVLVLGTGGVSVFAAQIALAAGARVIATSSSDDKLKRMQQLGVAASDCINYKTTPEWSDRVLELTGGRGVDHVIEVGGKATIDHSMASTKCGGTVSLVGFVGGGKASIDFLKCMAGGLVVRGIAVGSRADFQDLLDAMANNESHFPSIVDKTFKFEDAVEAYKYLESQQHFGKVLINID